MFRAFYSCYNIKNFEITSDSELRVIEEEALACSSNESITHPSNVQELKAAWKGYSNKIVVNYAENKNLLDRDDFLLDKSSLNYETFNVLISAKSHIEKVKIPNFVEIIQSNAFINCYASNRDEFEDNSKLRIIIKYAFVHIPIKSINIPSHATTIYECIFYNCVNLTEDNFDDNSELQTIGKNAFFMLKIDKINIHPHVILIDESSFLNCVNMKKVSIPINSEIQIIEHRSFENTLIESLAIPSIVVAIKSNWCYHTPKLNSIKIYP